MKQESGGGGHHLLKHTAPSVAQVVDCFDGAPIKDIARMIMKMGQRELQAKFNAVYNTVTRSNNNDWLRRKLYEAIGIKTHTKQKSASKRDSKTGVARACKVTKRTSSTASRPAKPPQSCTAAEAPDMQARMNIAFESGGPPNMAPTYASNPSDSMDSRVSAHHWSPAQHTPPGPYFRVPSRVPSFASNSSASTVVPMGVSQQYYVPHGGPSRAPPDMSPQHLHSTGMASASPQTSATYPWAHVLPHALPGAADASACQPGGHPSVASGRRAYSTTGYAEPVPRQPAPASSLQSTPHPGSTSDGLDSLADVFDTPAPWMHQAPAPVQRPQHPARDRAVAAPSMDGQHWRAGAPAWQNHNGPSCGGQGAVVGALDSEAEEDVLVHHPNMMHGGSGTVRMAVEGDAALEAGGAHQGGSGVMDDAIQGLLKSAYGDNFEDVLGGITQSFTRVGSCMSDWHDQVELDRLRHI